MSKSLLHYEPIFQQLRKRLPEAFIDHLTAQVGPGLIENNDLIFAESMTYAEVLFELVKRIDSSVAQLADPSIFLHNSQTRLFEECATETALNIEAFLDSKAYQNYKTADLAHRKLLETDEQEIDLNIQRLQAIVKNEEKILLEQQQKIEEILLSSKKIELVTEKLHEELNQAQNSSCSSLCSAAIMDESLSSSQVHKMNAKRPISRQEKIELGIMKIPRPLSGLKRAKIEISE